jgi:hypothetical protein
MGNVERKRNTINKNQKEKAKRQGRDQRFAEEVVWKYSINSLSVASLGKSICQAKENQTV